MNTRVLAAAGALLIVSASARGEEQIRADVYLDKARGMWMGQVLGNYAGRGKVPGTDEKREGYVVRGGADFDVGWDAILAHTSWWADDDTNLEYMYLDLLGRTSDPGAADIRQAWVDNITSGGLYIANKQARWLMEPPPVGASFLPPETGRHRHNMNWYAIDSQIATESIGTLLPGMPQKAADLCRRFAEVTNEGYPVHAAQFYAAMYAAAALDGDVAGVVETGLGVVPATSRTHEVVQAVRDRYEADKDAGLLDDPNTWRQTQTMLYDYYGSWGLSHGRYRGWIESTVNVGLTTMALLYGRGDFRRTVEIGVLGGYDADCNPATAGGLIGMMQGYEGADGLSGILADLPAVPSDVFDVRSLRQAGCITLVSQVAADFQAAAEAQLLATGGSIDGAGAERAYTIPADPILPPTEKPDPTGPGGLVGRVLAAGGGVEVHASVEYRDGAHDRRDLDAVIDGVTGLTYNGRLPYWSEDGDNPQPAGGDYYELRFERPMTFRSLTYHEGDISWSGINANPRQAEPRGGYFTTLLVEVFSGGAWREAAGLELGEPLDPFAYFQQIELTFDPVAGQRIRIRGQAGGTWEFTSIVELEAEGVMGVPGDADEDGDVDRADFVALRGSFGTEDADWPAGDFNFDSRVDFLDYVALKAHHRAAPAGAVPEPTAAFLLAAVLPLATRQRRRR